TADFSPPMLTAAQHRAQRLALTNVRFRQMDANRPLDQPAASLDGVLCRWGYMLLNDGEDALRETRRVLKPGAAVALAVWAGPEDNRWSVAPLEILRRRGLADPGGEATGLGQPAGSLVVPAATWVAARPRRLPGHVLRRRRRPGPAEGQDRGDPGLRLAGARARAQPLRLRRRGRRRAARR